ncbi:MAG: hypothetical protein IMZ61_14805 [Planctomycetes bacterium]|nr:hypothetical protein [Planctomycetota bacterium]
MSELASATPAEELQRIVESAKRLGVEIKEADALQWLTAMSTLEHEDTIVVDDKSGVFGHRISMLDFSPVELAHFRRVGKIVEFLDEPGVVQTALALSGSAAQSKIQTYPGDADYFERVNIVARTRAEACSILSRIMRDKALSTTKGLEYQLIEVKFGSYTLDMQRGDRTVKKGSPIAWLPVEIQAGCIQAVLPDGSPTKIRWEDVAGDPGWCKLDWVVIDLVRKTLINASNMLDVTWEAPDGSITPLDGYLDPYFQEVYLEADSIPVFTKLAKHVSSDALDNYVKALEHEVQKYLTGTPNNYGKAAKRMYNIFRFTGRYQEAAFLRELFDEPATVLYQVWSLIRTIDDCFKPDSGITKEALLAQTDELIIMVVKSLEGEAETEIVRMLLHLRDILSSETFGQGLSPLAEAVRAEIINLVNNFYYDKMTAVPEIKAYMDSMTLGK